MTHATPFHFHVVWCLLWLEFWSQTDSVQVYSNYSLGVTLGKHPKPVLPQFPKL